MSIWILLALIVGLTAAMLFVLHPLQVIARREFWLSHGVIWLGLWLLWGFVVFQNPDQPIEDMTMLMGAIWTLGGGICFAFLFTVRRLHSNRKQTKNEG